MDGWTDGWMDGWMDGCAFTSFSVISGRWGGNIERLRAMEPRLRLKRFPTQAGLESGPLDQEASA